MTPNLSIELGGLGFRLYRGDGKPLLEKFLLLNQLEMAFCVDVDIHPTSSIEFGGLLVLDDFGIELGGGDSDGGNGMAKGLLSGGDDGKDAVKPIFDIAISKYNGYDMDLSIRGGTEFGSQSTSNSVQSMLLKLEWRSIQRIHQEISRILIDCRSYSMRVQRFQGFMLHVMT